MGGRGATAGVSGFNAQLKREERIGGRGISEDRFYGTKIRVSNKYFTFNHVHSDDEVIVVTDNIKNIKGNPVLVVGNNEAVYLKDWNIKRIHNYDQGINSYAVKLNKKYFKTYKFKNGFDDFYFKKTENWKDMVKTAKEQNIENLKWATGHMKSY